MSTDFLVIDAGIGHHGGAGTLGTETRESLCKMTFHKGGQGQHFCCGYRALASTAV